MSIEETFANMAMPEQQNTKTREVVRALIIIALAFAASYVSTSAKIDNRVTVVETLQNANNAEVLRRLDSIQQDVRELRARGK